MFCSGSQLKIGGPSLCLTSKFSNFSISFFTKRLYEISGWSGSLVFWDKKGLNVSYWLHIFWRFLRAEKLSIIIWLVNFVAEFIEMVSVLQELNIIIVNNDISNKNIETKLYSGWINK